MDVVRSYAWFGVWAVAFGATVWADAAPEPGRGRAPQGSRATILRSDQASDAPFVRDPIQNLEAWRAVPSFRLEAVDVAALDQEDAVRDLVPGVPMRAGVNRAVAGAPLSAGTDGVWSQASNGSRVWSLQVESPGAVALRVHFSRFELSPDTRLVFRGNKDEASQVYTELGPLRNGAFWAPLTLGDVVFFEFQDPQGTGLMPLIEIDELSHLYRGADGSDEREGGDTGGVSSAALPCHQDVNCMGAEAIARDSVGRMVVTVPGQGSFFCSGALVEDEDPNTYAGYFLTAHHCLSTQAVADTLLVYWFHQTDECGGTIPSLSVLPRSLGAVLLATSSQTDFTFLRLLDDPRDGQGFSPLTTEAPSVGETVACIHHPGGAYKRYADGPVTVSPPICPDLPLDRYLYNDWTVLRGVTEGGSSGGPLFNAQWEIVGQLFGVCFFANPTCFNPSEYNAVSGRMSVTYPLIESFLSQVTPDDDFEDNDTLEDAAVVEAGVQDLRLVDLEDYFRLSIAEAHEVVVGITFDPQEMDAELRLLSADGSELDGVAAMGGAGTVSAHVVAGDYVIRVSKTGGWGGDYTLEVELLETSCVALAGAVAEAPVLPKNRFISFEPGDNPGTSAAIRVSLAALNRTNGDDPGIPDFSAAEGSSMWVGPPEWFSDSSGSPPGYFAARLQCEPYYTDWSGMGLIHVYGPEVVPASTYEIESISEHCTAVNPQNYSAMLEVTTNRWGDVAAPFWPAVGGQPNFSDVSALVDRFRSAPGSIPTLSAQLQPMVPVPGANVNFADVSACVDAFRGLPYPFSGPQSCP
jgi:hypothetical protein